MVEPGAISEKVCRALRKVLKQARLESGLSLNELSKRAGLNRMAISFVEKGERTPTLETFFRIAAALGIAPSALLQMAERDVGDTNWQRLAQQLADRVHKLN